MNNIFIFLSPSKGSGNTTISLAFSHFLKEKKKLDPCFIELTNNKLPADSFVFDCLDEKFTDEQFYEFFSSKNANDNFIDKRTLKIDGIEYIIKHPDSENQHIGVDLISKLINLKLGKAIVIDCSAELFYDLELRDFIVNIPATFCIIIDPMKSKLINKSEFLDFFYLLEIEKTISYKYIVNKFDKNHNKKTIDLFFHSHNYLTVPHLENKHIYNDDFNSVSVYTSNKTMLTKCFDDICMS